MANALRFAATDAPAPPSTLNGPAVALIAADEAARVMDVRCKLEQTGLFSRVDAIDPRAGTPALSQLVDYGAVLTWSNGSYGDASALGTTLADYVDQNKGVVQSVVNLTPASGGTLNGRWVTDGYRPFSAGPLTGGSRHHLAANISAHVTLAGVADVDGGALSHHAGPIGLESAQTLVASWDLDNQALLATGRAPSGGRVVGLNMYPPSGAASPGSWESASDGARLLANALLFAANRFPSADAGIDQSSEAGTSMGAAFTLHGSGADPAGDVLSFHGQARYGGGPERRSRRSSAAGAAEIAHRDGCLSVADGKGARRPTRSLTVTDMTAPVLHNMPSRRSPPKPPGRAVHRAYGPVTANDAVTRRAGDLLTCRRLSARRHARDVLGERSRDNTVADTFTVRVTEPQTSSTPGRMHGAGLVGCRRTSPVCLRSSRDERGAERAALASRLAAIISSPLRSTRGLKGNTCVQRRGPAQRRCRIRYEGFATDTANLVITIACGFRHLSSGRTRRSRARSAAVI